MGSNNSVGKPVLLLFRHDLRLADNRALAAARETGRPIAAAFIHDEESKGVRAPGGARRWWLHHSLEALSDGLSQLGGRLILRRGAMAKEVARLVRDTGADTVFWNRRYDPPAVAADKTLRQNLKDEGIAAESFEGQLLHEPWQVSTTSGGHYKVYTPFRRALMSAPEPREPLGAPRKMEAWGGKAASERLSDWKLLPTKPDWAGGLRETWTPGEAGARKALSDFIADMLEGYGEGRDFPSRGTTSRLSPHLCHGEITPYQLWHALVGIDAPRADVEKFRSELIWREFCWHLLFHNADLATVNFNHSFDAFRWRRDAKALAAWQKGETGYPLVDAGMRELWRTGFMHNRVRMVVASFLAKHLLIDWRKGEEWFWDTLVDADPANNPANWQWVAGSGADAAPYFRIMNPLLQSEKFDNGGDYVRAYVPELGRLDGKALHKPWQEKPQRLAEAGVKIGETYPAPIVDHGKARERALAAYRSSKDN